MVPGPVNAGQQRLQPARGDVDQRRLNVPAFEQSLAEVVRRHEALRTLSRSTAVNREPVIGTTRSVKLPFVDLGSLKAPKLKRRALRTRMRSGRSTFKPDRCCG